MTQAQQPKARRITIEPITRLEGEAKIDIFLDDEGNVDNAYFQVVELRGFERFCQGRPVEEMPRITPRICGVCPGAHHMASSKAVDAVFNVDPPEPAKKLRKLFYCAHIIHSHLAHFYAFAAPDFALGPSAEPGKRNILGLIEAVGLEVGKKVITARSYAQRIQEMIGGKATHPVCGLPGGMSKPITEEERKEIEEMAKSLVEFSKFSLELVDNIILRNKDYMNLIRGDTYYHETYYMGMVDQNNNNKVNFYDGVIKVVNQKGMQYARFQPKDYLNHIEEHVEPWSYLKFPSLKNVGWKGLVDGKDSGIYRVNCLARMNVAEGMATPLAQEAYEKMYDVLGGKPSHATLAFKRIIRKAGLNHIRVHDLRHTHATLMLKAGVHPKIVSERLGHANIGITLDTYSHVLPGLQEAAAEKFDQVLDESDKIGNIDVSKLLAEGEEIDSRPYRSRTCDTLIKSHGVLV